MSLGIKCVTSESAKFARLLSAICCHDLNLDPLHTPIDVRRKRSMISLDFWNGMLVVFCKPDCKKVTPAYSGHLGRCHQGRWDESQPGRYLNIFSWV